MSNASQLADCRRCKRLHDYLENTANQYPEYHNRPVAAFGPAQAKLLIVGLAPGKHGANASGRPFTGDASGQLLFEMLYRFGFSSEPESVSREDALQLNDCCITNAVKCLPPGNKPETDEIVRCNSYLATEIDDLASSAVILALGAIAHKAVLKAQGLVLSHYRFAHAQEFELPSGKTLIDSYHCSRYNTQTKRLTAQMFAQVFRRIKQLLDND